MNRSHRFDRRAELLATRREEAIAFFNVNQAGRTAVERVVALFFSVAAIAGSVGVAAGTPDVALPLPALLFLLLSYMFQQYADLTVLGTARRRLEDLVNHELAGKGLIYETAVAEIRQKAPLVRSVRLLQALLGLVVLGATIAAAIVAVRDHDWRVDVGFFAATALAAASALYSYRHMYRSAAVAGEAMGRQGLENRHMVWISSDLHRRVMKRAMQGELEQETVVRLLAAALEGSDDP